MRSVHTANLLLVVALLGGCLFAWPNLPESIPTHFDLAGTPDRWSDRSVLAWFGPPAIALLILGMCYFLAWIIPKYPGLLSMPDKGDRRTCRRLFFCLLSASPCS